ncbi:MAG TPA: hypothetical protein VIH17_01215 [Candidatus Acidoferrales bacterium]
MEADKTMFEIYREATYSGKYKVVYFTELHDHNKEFEIISATEGEHYYDGFIKNWRKDKAKLLIDKFVRRLNEGEKLTPADLECELAEYIPQAT